MVNKEAMFTSNKEDWCTPKELFNELNNEFKFICDVASSTDNKLCCIHYTKEDNAKNVAPFPSMIVVFR